MDRISNRLLLKYKLVAKEASKESKLENNNEEKNELDELARDFN